MTESHNRPGGRRVLELIELGRDREAAVLGDDGPLDEEGAPMDVLRQLDQLGPVLGGVVGAITPDALDRPTPCAEYTVAGILDHMVSGATAFAAAFRGTEPGTADTADPLGAFGPALGGLVDAIQQPGALDRDVASPFGQIPGDTFARFVVLDGLVHGWDLATATGQSYDPPEALVAAVHAFAEDALPPLRGTAFADEAQAPASATPMERLAAYAGRTVG